MASIFNMRDTTDWSSPDYRPKNYREMAFKLWPTSPTPLTYLLSKLPSRTTDDPEYNIFEWRLPQQVWTLTAADGADAGNPDTSVVGVAAGEANGLKVGDILEEESTNNQYKVTVASTDGAAFSIIEWADTNNVPAVDDVLRWVGSVYLEGSGAPESVMRTPSMVTNYTQIFKDSVEITGTADATRTRPFKPWAQAKAECLERHMLKLEYATLRGRKKELTTGANPARTFGGLNYYITEAKDFESGGMSMDDLEDQLQIAFKYGTKDKGLVVGNTAIKIMNRVARNHAALQFNMTDKMNKDQTFGLDVAEWVTPFGILRIIPHALMSESDAYTQDGYILDFKYLEYVKLRGRDTKWFPNAQDNDQDSKRGYYQTECGFSVALPEVHQKWTNLDAFGADTPPV
jgi:hypothetical protein